ncbi:MAG: hypothetical protein IIW02_03620 [Clostridia bacterium]|nr:hypothetical protein [Clostridia bacterium]
MENIFKISKRGIIALTLCILLGIAGTGLNVTAMVAETTATVEETAVATEDTTVVTEENTQELVPRMARACWGTLDEALDYYIGKNNWSYDANGSPQASGFNIYVSNGDCRVTGNDVSYSFYFG